MKEKKGDAVFDSVDELLAGRIMAHATGRKEPEAAPAPLTSLKPADTDVSSVSSAGSTSPEAAKDLPAPEPADDSSEPACRRDGIGRLIIAALVAVALILAGVILPTRKRKKSRWF